MTDVIGEANNHSALGKKRLTIHKINATENTQNNGATAATIAAPINRSMFES